MFLGILLIVVGVLISLFGVWQSQILKDIPSKWRKILIYSVSILLIIFGLINIGFYVNQNSKIKQLEIGAKKASRGISSTYDFNGAKRVTTGPGHVSVVIGEEFTIFQGMVQLEKAKNYEELVKVCDEQIQKTPDWLTPYLFAGIAYANLGDKEKAIMKLEYVLEMAPGDPAYAQASDILKELNK